ncbi:hypothetical protein VTK73DRAFT_9706 [Phialemonium thermophilum]|uniref:Uncharacterized protein n=1 Tax=Phialemonium thermophilum TaxID=223376 RepID=A0ABR3XJM1_9PEZI
MRRLRTKRHSSWSSCEVMGSLPEDPTTTSRPRRRDTGFPEPFCGNRNTTLPHPDAIVAPDASITADDIAVQRVLSRQRRSFLVKHKRTISHGLITPEMNRVDSAVSLESNAEPPSSLARNESVRTRHPKGSGESVSSAPDWVAYDSVELNPCKANTHRGLKQRKGILHKFVRR